MLKCTINDKEFEVPEGTTVIEALWSNQIDIAHYCWHPGLSVAGVCRMCMVEIKGQSKLQIACNTKVTDGMVITNQSEKVKEAVKWTLDFHLINHPLDCPICDQAGECGLQEQYMRFGKYDPEMSQPKVKKRKVVDLGPKIVLDTERCILCSRCVRFTDEVSKTHELAIFNRGDHSEIGTTEDKPLDNNYSVNTVDICPVGALTSRDFRFQQRVWYLKEVDSICPGCSTGCNIKVHYNKESVFRIKPRFHPEVNGFWMCDEGRDVYRYVNKEHRLLTASKVVDGKKVTISPEALAQEVALLLKDTVRQHSPDHVALILTAQYTTEELASLMDFFRGDLNSQNVYYWINNQESFDSFDGILLRGDRNPNTMGLLQLLEKNKLTRTWTDLEQMLAAGQIKVALVAGPENQLVYPDLNLRLNALASIPTLVWLTACKNSVFDSTKNPVWQLPVSTFFEKQGSFVNFKGISQKIKPGRKIVSQALNLVELTQLLRGPSMTSPRAVQPLSCPKVSEDSNRVQNEFVYIRGQL